MFVKRQIFRLHIAVVILIDAVGAIAQRVMLLLVLLQVVMAAGEQGVLDGLAQLDAAGAVAVVVVVVVVVAAAVVVVEVERQLVAAAVVALL